MNTFLPFANFTDCASVLDRARLGKQRLEVLQILRTLCGDSNGWESHPAVLMWESYEGALSLYGLEICRQWKSRGYEDNLYKEIKPYFDRFWKEDCMPPWIGYPQLHSNYRSVLLFKGMVDAYCSPIPGRSKNNWLKANGFPAKHNFKTITQLNTLRRFLCQQFQFGKASFASNWYEKFGWTERSDLNFEWPTYDVAIGGYRVGHRIIRGSVS